ncbi:MAG: hypothetical protein HY698_05140 [Deltaproteobacteria bacterium]|nr:hypothetical protein [Deltaproteobacteria bacterium]
MPIPLDRRRSALARQVGSLALAQVRLENPMAVVRAATWHNSLCRIGLTLPFFVVSDLGLLLTTPKGPGGLGTVGGAGNQFVMGALPSSEDASPSPRSLLASYVDLLARISSSEVVEKAASYRLKDDIVAALIARILGDVTLSWNNPAKGVGGAELPLDPALYADADIRQHFADFDPGPLWSFLQAMERHAWHVVTCVEQVDLDTLRLLSLFRGTGDEQGAPLCFVDLENILRSPEANDVVNFSLELLPSILETKRATGVTASAVDGLASIERRGNLDSLVLTELAYDDDVFDRKLLDQELFFYGREKQRDEQRRLEYILVDSSASMRGERQVFARGLALALAKKQALEGNDAWIRFFDSRLHDTIKLSRGGAAQVPSFLAFRSERGRNYGKVFRQLMAELSRMQRESPRQVVLHIITHGQCHVPVELIAALKKLAFLHGIIILPSSELSLEYLPLLDRHQIISAETLASRKERRDRALGIVQESGTSRHA